MNDIFMFCENPDCSCNDICCQECNKLKECNHKCEAIRFKERIYNDEEFLIENLEQSVIKSNNWILAVGLEKLKELREQNEVLKKAFGLLRKTEL